MSGLGLYVLDENGDPQPEPDVLRWSDTFMRDKRVDETTINDIRISTVFLGVDHNFFGEGDPILWETMIFGGSLSGYQERYSSRPAAVAGHAEAVAKVLQSLA